MGVTVTIMTGCGSNGESQSKVTAKQAALPKQPENTANKSQHAGDGLNPQEVVQAFLTSFKEGDGEATSSYLTKTAREQAEKADMEIAPPGSPSAEFEVGDWEYVTDAKDGVHVATIYTETQPNGEKVAQQVVWMLRTEPEGWRIAGMATRVFPELPPLFLNFEDQADMQRKLELVQQELARRANAPLEQAREESSSPNQLR